MGKKIQTSNFKISKSRDTMYTTVILSERITRSRKTSYAIAVIHTGRA